MQKLLLGSLPLILAAAFIMAAPASGKPESAGKPASPLNKVKSEKKESYYFRVPHESATPHLIEECPSIVLPQPKQMKACEDYVSGSDIKALRCKSLDGRFLYLVYKTKEDCLIDREATLANEG